jgi:hypothetical protein
MKAHPDECGSEARMDTVNEALYTLVRASCDFTRVLTYVLNALTFLDPKCRLDIPKARGKKLDGGRFMGDLPGSSVRAFLLYISYVLVRTLSL